MHFRKVLGGVLFAAIVIGALDLRPLRVLFADRAALAEVLTRAPDLQAPTYPAFLEEVARRTKPGDSIAILVPMRHWARGYAYAYFRATYFLAGRDVIPLVDADDHEHPERLRDARYVAVWHLPVLPGPWEEVWRGPDGVLLRRTSP
ncbi:MAG TPA: hypothetical protein VJZ00_15520 [Thermoanaerobaculia bacterium]|nr:hypothetical protein [Thermoanaerobaculia bacterium]